MLWQILSREYDAFSTHDSNDVPEPPARTGHTATSLPDGRVVVFGGYDGFNFHNDVYIFSPDASKWTEIYQSPGSENSSWPESIAFHSANLVSLEDGSWSILFFGGVDLHEIHGSALRLRLFQGENLLSVLENLNLGAVLNSPTFVPIRAQWEIISFENADSEFYHEAAQRPQNRMQHSSVLVDALRLLVLGGLSRGGRRLADLWELDLACWEWRQIQLRGWGPSSGHTALLLQPGRLLVFGGESAEGQPLAGGPLQGCQQILDWPPHHSIRVAQLCPREELHGEEVLGAGSLWFIDFLTPDHLTPAQARPAPLVAGDAAARPRLVPRGGAAVAPLRLASETVQFCYHFYSCASAPTAWLGTVHFYCHRF